MRKSMGLKVALLVVGLLTMAVAPATAQLGDPLSLAASGVLLPFFNDTVAGFVSVFEVTSPIVGFTGLTCQGESDCNPMHAVFFSATCARQTSATITETNRQAVAFIGSAAPLTLTFNGLAAIAATANGFDLQPLLWPIHSRVHWIDTSKGRVRELEPIILDTFINTLSSVPLIPFPATLPSVGLCNDFGRVEGVSPFCWNPLRSGATVVTPQDSASLKSSFILICPRSTIQAGSSAGGSGLAVDWRTGSTQSALIDDGSLAGGVFPRSRFPTLWNRDGSTGFPASNAITGGAATTLRALIIDDNEVPVRDTQIPCDCLTNLAVANIDVVYTLPPTNLGANTVPVWLTILEEQSATTALPAQSREFSFTGYLNLEVVGHEATLFHRFSNASRDNLETGTSNIHKNR